MALETVQGRLREQRRTTLTLIKKHPALLFSGAYLLLTGIGLLYSTIFFNSFGLSFNDFAQPSDLLLMAALKEPLLIAFFLGSLLFVYFLFRLDFWMRKTFSWHEALYRSNFCERFSYHPFSIIFMIVVYAVLFTFFYAGVATKTVKDGEANKIVVQLRAADGPEPLRRTLLGTTSSFALAYDTETKEARAIPFESIVSLVVAAEQDTSAAILHSDQKEVAGGPSALE